MKNSSSKSGGVASKCRGRMAQSQEIRSGAKRGSSINDNKKESRILFNKRHI